MKINILFVIKKILWFFLPICFFLTSLSFGLGTMPIDWYYGRRLNFSDAYSLSTAGVELFKPIVSWANPLTKAKAKPDLTAAYYVDILSERRTVQVYDQFDNTIGEVAISDNTLARGNLANFYFLMPFDLLNISVSRKPIISYNYYYYQEFRDDFYTKIGETELKVLGQLCETAIMVGKQFKDMIGVSIGLNYYDGKRTYHYHDSMLNSNVVNADSIGNLNGLGLTLDFSYKPFERLLINLGYQSPIKVNKFINPDITVKYPAIYKLNVAYLASGEIPTKLGVQTQYSNWKTLDSTYQSSWEVGFGIEHILLTSVALRYGFRLQPSFIEPIVHLGAVSVGWGFEIGIIQVDIGAEIGRRIIYAENLTSANDNTMKIYQNTAMVIGGLRLPIDRIL